MSLGLEARFYLQVQIAIKEQWLTLDNWADPIKSPKESPGAPEQQLRKTEWKEGIRMSLGLQYKVTVLSHLKLKMFL